MRTTIFIDDALMCEALELTGAKSKREVVDTALRTLVALRRQEEVRKFRGKFDWEGERDAGR